MEHIDSCYERPKKYMTEVLQQVTEFRKYRDLGSWTTPGWKKNLYGDRAQG
jgi:hypothetical protein